MSEETKITFKKVVEIKVGEISFKIMKGPKETTFTMSTPRALLETEIAISYPAMVQIMNFLEGKRDV